MFPLVGEVVKQNCVCLASLLSWSASWQLGSLISSMVVCSCGSLASLRPCRRCAGVSGSGSVISSEICVRRRSFNIASTSETTV